MCNLEGPTIGMWAGSPSDISGQWAGIAVRVVAVVVKWGPKVYKYGKRVYPLVKRAVSRINQFAKAKVGEKIAQRNGKNRVFDGEKAYDLRGPGHYRRDWKKDVPTPHTIQRRYNTNPVTGERHYYWDSKRPTSTIWRELWRAWRITRRK